jgi:hypothetical protein
MHVKVLMNKSGCLNSLIHRDAGEFDSTQLMALKEFLPTRPKSTLRWGIFAKDLSGSEENKEKSMAALPSCEKYMIAMMEAKNAPAKFDCMLFRSSVSGVFLMNSSWASNTLQEGLR